MAGTAVVGDRLELFRMIMPRIPIAQLKELLSWMEVHPRQARGITPLYPSSPVNQMIRYLWEELVSKLNAMDNGIARTQKEWRGYWNDIKCRARKKKREGELLTPTEERIVTLLSSDLPNLQSEMAEYIVLKTKNPHRKPSRQVEEEPSEPSTGEYPTLVLTPLRAPWDRKNDHNYSIISSQSLKKRSQLDDASSTTTSQNLAKRPHLDETIASSTITSSQNLANRPHLDDPLAFTTINSSENLAKRIPLDDPLAFSPINSSQNLAIGTKLDDPLALSTTSSSQNMAKRPQLDEPVQKMDRYDYMVKVWAETLKELPITQRILTEKIINDVFCEAQLNNLTRESHLRVHKFENVEYLQVAIENPKILKGEDPDSDEDTD